MYLLEYITESFSTIRANKLRSGLSLIGIIVGVTSVVSLVGMGNGMKEQINKSFSSSNNMITIAQGKEGTSGFAMVSGGMPGGSDNSSPQTSYEVTYAQGQLFSMEMVERLQKNFRTNIVAIVPKYANINATVTYNGEGIYANVAAGSADYFRARKMQIGYGMGFSDRMKEAEQKVVIIGSNLVQDVFRGSDPIGQSLFINGQSFKVIGIFELTSDYSIDSTIFLPFEVASKQFDLSKIESIEVFVSDVTKISTTQTQLQTWLSKYFPVDTGDIFHLQTNEKIMKEIQKMNDSFALFIIGIASISLFVGGIGIMNVMLVSVTERTREIGIRKAIGATRGDIMLQFLVESGTITGIGGIMAIGLSFLIGNFLVKLIPGGITFIIDMETILMTTGFSVFMGIFFGLIPAWKAAKKNPIDALRFE